MRTTNFDLVDELCHDPVWMAPSTRVKSQAAPHDALYDHRPPDFRSSLSKREW